MQGGNDAGDHPPITPIASATEAELGAATRGGCTTTWRATSWAPCRPTAPSRARLPPSARARRCSRHRDLAQAPWLHRHHALEGEAVLPGRIHPVLWSHCLSEALACS